MKNKYLIAANIEDAKDQLDEILNDLENDKEFSEVEFRIFLEHAYHHLNYAWHIRNIDPESKHSKAEFKEWSKFPIGEITEYE